MEPSKSSCREGLNTTTVAPAHSSAGRCVKRETQEEEATALSSVPGTSDDDGQDSWEKERPLRRKRRVKGQKICGVCGDLAQSHNFGTLTCETCKAFFRRNAFKQKELQTCVFNSSCTITKATRRFCAPCRLKKCYAVGMDPELILDGEERRERQRKQDHTSARRKVDKEFQETGAALSSANPGPSRSIATPGTDAAPRPDPPLTGCSSSGGNPGGSGDSRSLPESGSCCCLCRRNGALGLHFRSAGTETLPRNSALYWSLTHEETFLLERLTSQYSYIFNDAGTAAAAPLDLRDIPVETVMVAVNLLLRKFVTFSKRVPQFSQLQECDQITLLKATAMRLYCLRLAEVYIPERKSWKSMVGEVSESGLKHLFQEPRILREIMVFCEGVKFVVKDDTTLYALMYTLVLFDPRDPSIENRVLVNNIKDKYMVLLKHHLESQFSFLHADRYLGEMVQICLDLEDLGHNLVLFFNDEEKRARQSKRERDEAQAGKKEKSQGDTQVTTSTATPNADARSPADAATSPGSSADSGNDSGACTPSPYDYPNKGKWCRPRNALGRRFKHVAREELPWDMQMYWPLTVEERASLTHLTSSYQSSTSVFTREDQERMHQWDSFCMEKAIFALEHAMRQYVQFARVIPEFQSLSQGDQIAVLKASALQWYHIRTASHFIPERRAWVNFFGAFAESELGSFFGDAHGVQQYADFCEGLKFVVKNDTTLYALMHTLVLFDPRDANIENRVLVNNIKDKYMLLLKHHLESQFSFLHADRYLVEMMEQILDLQQLSQSSMVFYRHFSSQFRPLVAEVLSE